MTRQEEIKFEAVIHAEEQPAPTDYVIAAKADHFNGFVEGFHAGAEWADETRRMSKDLAGFLTICIVQFIDRNTSGMCLSSMECEELEKAFLDGNFAKIEIFTKLKLQENVVNDKF